MIVRASHISFLCEYSATPKMLFLCPLSFFALALIFALPKHRNLRGNPTETLAAQAICLNSKIVLSNIAKLCDSLHLWTIMVQHQCRIR